MPNMSKSILAPPQVYKIDCTKICFEVMSEAIKVCIILL